MTAAQSGETAVGLYGQPGAATPAFLVAAATTNLDRELLMTGLAAGMQQSAGRDSL